MTEKDEKNIEYYLADIITDEPHEFHIGRKVLRLYPVTLGKMTKLRRYMDALKINTDLLTTNPDAEVLRLVVNHREVCCGILAIHTAPNTYKDLFNMKARAERRNLLMKVGNADLAALLLTVLTSDRTAELMASLGIDKEQERMGRVMEVKRRHSKNSISFGGLSVFGSFIGQLKEIGYTDSEILYERGYSYLRLMLADKITSVYLSDEELKELSALDTGKDAMDANDPRSADKILGTLANRGLKIH